MLGASGGLLHVYASLPSQQELVEVNERNEKQLSFFGVNRKDDFAIKQSYANRTVLGHIGTYILLGDAIGVSM